MRQYIGTVRAMTMPIIKAVASGNGNKFLTQK
jgi:hypothetical protein